MRELRSRKILILLINSVSDFNLSNLPTPIYVLETFGPMTAWNFTRLLDERIITALSFFLNYISRLCSKLLTRKNSLYSKNLYFYRMDVQGPSPIHDVLLTRYFQTTPIPHTEVRFNQFFIQFRSFEQEQFFKVVIHLNNCSTIVTHSP